MQESGDTTPVPTREHRGSCLCGGVRYVYRGEITEISRCHCSQCRKASGSAFVAVAPVATAGLEITQGAELLARWRATPIKERVFCSRCGSPLYSARDDLPDIRRLRIGTLDTPLAVDRQYHIFAEHPADWYRLDETLPRYAAMPPEASGVAGRSGR